MAEKPVGEVMCIKVSGVWGRLIHTAEKMAKILAEKEAKKNRLEKQAEKRGHTMGKSARGNEKDKVTTIIIEHNG